jgi:hypothetical protein
MEEILQDKNNIKKYLSNNISYTINKKMSVYTSKLDKITKMLEYNIEKNDVIIDSLKNNNLFLEEKIKSLESLIVELSDKIISHNSQTKINNVDINNDYIENIEYVEKEKIKKKNNKKDIIIEKQILNIDDDIDSDNNSYTENKNFKYHDIKLENINVENDFIKKCLHMCSLNGDIKLFKKIYIDNIPKEYYPIRNIKKTYQYWNNNHMNDDDGNGTYIKNTILKNIERAYLKINTFENYSDDTEQFLKNQEHINNIMEEKYKDKFLSKVIQLINI